VAKLSKCSVGQVERRSTDYIFWNELTPGFGVRLSASGERSYVVEYRAKRWTRWKWTRTDGADRMP
jgi:hypothetical protein